MIEDPTFEEQLKSNLAIINSQRSDIFNNSNSNIFYENIEHDNNYKMV